MCTCKIKPPPSQLLMLLNRYSSPSDLVKAAKDAKIYVKNALSSRSNKFNCLEEMVKVLDDISDKMCVVTDSAECIRRLHPEIKWKRAAEEAFNATCKLMNDLNSDRNLIDEFCALEKGQVNGDKELELDAVVKEFKKDFDLFKTLNDTEKKEIMKLKLNVDESAVQFEKVQSIESLEKMVRLRFELARALGFRSPLEMSLRNKQLKTSSEVNSFLLSKREALKLNTTTIKGQIRMSSTNIKAVFDALTVISKDLFNVKIKLETCYDLAGHETISLFVYDKRGCFVGEIIFDLSARKLKDPHPTHYTIQCRKFGTPALILLSLSIDDLNRIPWNQSQSIFHEFGHALHSVLSETQFQMLSGTRGPVDLAEIPSTLLELIHDDMQQELSTDNSKNSFKIVPGERILKEETYQLQIASLDQLLHSISPQGIYWSRDLARQIEKDYPIKNAQRNEHWHCKIQHLATYGGGYFAYSFSKTIAAKIWKTFPNGSTIFMNEFLCKGGTASLDFIK